MGTDNISSCGSGGYRDYDGDCRYYSSWYWWGRWVFAGLAVLFILLVFAGLLYVYPRVCLHGVWKPTNAALIAVTRAVVEDKAFNRCTERVGWRLRHLLTTLRHRNTRLKIKDPQAVTNMARAMGITPATKRAFNCSNRRVRTTAVPNPNMRHPRDLRRPPTPNK